MQPIRHACGLEEMPGTANVVDDEIPLHRKTKTVVSASACQIPSSVEQSLSSTGGGNWSIPKLWPRMEFKMDHLKRPLLALASLRMQFVWWS